MKCSRCEQENPTAQKFCGQCGSPFDVLGAAGYAELEAENERLRRSLADSLEQQTATGDILRAISASPGDLTAVLGTVAATASRLCDAANVSVYQIDGDVMHKVAGYGPELTVVPVGGTRKVTRGSVSGRAILDRTTIRVRDQQAPDVRREFPDGARQDTGIHTTVGIPLLRNGSAIGAFTVYRTEPRPFSDAEIAVLQVFADQAVIAIENARLFNETKQALGQQTATADILKLIALSPTDVQPVLDAVAERAARICEASDALIQRVVGETMVRVAHFGPMPLLPSPWRPLTRANTPGRAILERRPIHIHDLGAPEAVQEYPDSVTAQRAHGLGTVLSVPLVRDGAALGAITIRRAIVRPFTDNQIALLQTFADQAVIAIENVRLFNETKEALEQQTATSEILHVIARSRTDIQPVFDAVAESAARLCDSSDAEIFRRDGDRLRLVAHHGSIPSTTVAVPLVRETFNGRTVLDGRTFHIADLQSETDEFPQGSKLARQHGTRAQLSVPLMREGVAIGTISLRRTEARLFTERQVALLQTFADQAVIAIENVRLFKELEARNRDLTESLDRQTATADILRVISKAQTDVQPVFETIADSAMRLFGAWSAAVWRYDSEYLIVAAARGGRPGSSEAMLERSRPRRAADAPFAGRTVSSRSVQQIIDVETDPTLDPVIRENARERGWRTTVQAPMLRGDDVVGVIGVTRAQPGGFSPVEIALLKTFADQAVIAIENARLFNETKQALEQQTATAEILSVMSQSPTDVQPVFDAIVRAAVRLCDGVFSIVGRFDGEYIHFGAQYNFNADALAVYHQWFPRRATEDRLAGRAVLERRVMNVADVSAEFRFVPGQQEQGFRSVVFVPMVRDGVSIGVIGVSRMVVGAFPQQQVELLQAFADQAVIAIENVRLFTELQEKNRELTKAHAQVTEALSQQTATSDVLRIISSSPTDLQPVLDTMAESAARLCVAPDVLIMLRDEERLLVRAHFGKIALGDVVPVVRESVSGRAVLDKRPVHVEDLTVADDLPVGQQFALRDAFRTALAVPLIRKNNAIGAILVRRAEVQLFTDKQIELIETFADQAVIAIENVRLFTELEASNRELTTALDQQTATSEILRVISRSQTDVQPVFDTIVQSAVRLCAGLFGALFQFDGELLHMVAHHNYTPEALETAHQIYPARPSRDHGSVRAIVERAVVHIPDVELDPEHQHPGLRRAIGQRSGLFVPMLREGDPVGVIMVSRPEPGPFSNNEIELLKTFADQAVIAIENVRLFKELEARTRDLTRSVGELRALGEIGQAISSTLDLTAVLNTIVARATELSGTDAGVVYEYDEQREVFVPRATAHLHTEIVETMLATPVRKGEGATGRLAEVQQPIQMPDILAAPAESRVRGALVRSGYRSLLAVPLVRENRLLGGLTILRKATGDFAPEVIELLQTFATQSALAIQNARLFREIEDKSRQLEVASQHKSEFLANMSHELRTPLNAIIGFSEVLSERMFGDLNAKQEEYLKDIHASGQHLLSLINDILDLSKIEAGRMDLELADFYLPATLDNALTLVRERAGRHSISLHAAIDDRLQYIRGDERKIKQVLLNLLSNAIKFTPEGGRIDVEAKLVNESIQVSVNDTGAGIAPEDQEAIFEEFRQVGTAAKKVEGTGLGLALSRKFIELHGGNIWVKSELGAGSSFTFTIPVRHGG